MAYSLRRVSTPTRVDVRWRRNAGCHSSLTPRFKTYLLLHTDFPVLSRRNAQRHLPPCVYAAFPALRWAPARQTEHQLETGLVRKAVSPKHRLDEMTTRQSVNFVYYQEACRYWAKALKGLPRFKRNGVKMKPPHGRILHFEKGEAAALCAGLLNSSLFYWFYSAFSDCEHINDSLIRGFRIPPEWNQSDWTKVGEHLVSSLTANATKKADFDETRAHNRIRRVKCGTVQERDRRDRHSAR